VDSDILLLGILAVDGTVRIELFLAAVLIITLDQVSKRIAIERVRNAPSPSSRARIHVIANPSLGLGFVRTLRLLLALWIIATIGTLLLVHNVDALHGRAPQIALGAALGGATSNVFDKIRRGAVIDFVDLRVWPIFNLADAAIVIGVLAASWLIL
jgi:signal peptidase II